MENKKRDFHKDEDVLQYSSSFPAKCIFIFSIRASFSIYTKYRTALSSHFILHYELGNSLSWWLRYWDNSHKFYWYCIFHFLLKSLFLPLFYYCYLKQNSLESILLFICNVCTEFNGIGGWLFHNNVIRI